MSNLTLGIHRGIVDGVRATVIAIADHPEPVDIERIAKKSGEPFTITEACAGYYNEDIDINGETFKLTAQVQKFKNSKQSTKVIEHEGELTM